jgi:putative DNA-invertase from lambdoid prophage Rac
MQVGAYLRTSTRKQDLEGQRRSIATWAEREGHETAFFEDDAASGRCTDRQGIEDMLAAVERGEFPLVAMTELSRIGRSLSFIHQAVERIGRSAAKIVLTSTGFTLDPTTLEGKALVGALALAAEVEWHLIQERNARGRETIRARGVRVGAKPKDVSLAALRALREKGLSLREIAKELGTSAATITRRLASMRKDPEPPSPSG